MLSQKKKTTNKLRQVLINDKRIEPQRLQELLANDLYQALFPYLDIVPSDIKSRIDVESGEYVLRCKVRVKRLKILGFVPREEL